MGDKTVGLPGAVMLARRRAAPHEGTIPQMRSAPTLLTVVAIAACAAPAPHPAATPPRGEAARPMADAEEVLAAIREMETDPLREDDAFRTKVAEVLKRTYKSLGVPAVICIDLYPELDTEARPRGRVLLTQGLLGQARYLVEHPGASSKDEGMLTSGAASALRAYRKLVALHPEEQRPRWDKMDAAERGNELPRLVRDAMTACFEKGGR